MADYASLIRPTGYRFPSLQLLPISSNGPPATRTGRSGEGGIMAQTVADVLVGTLEQIGVKQVFGLIGDSLNPFVPLSPSPAPEREFGCVRWPDGL